MKLINFYYKYKFYIFFIIIIIIPLIILFFIYIKKNNKIPIDDKYLYENLMNNFNKIFPDNN